MHTLDIVVAGFVYNICYKADSIQNVLEIM